MFKSYLTGNTLTAKCVRGVTKLGAGTAIERGLRLILQMFLTRLLVPEEFMVWGIILAVIAVCEAVAEVGVRQAIVQNERGNTQEFMNAAWWFQVVRGGGLFILAILLSPIISGFYFTSKPEILQLYSRPELLLLLKIAFISILCNALTSPGIYVLRKEFRFGKLVIYQQGSGLIGTLVSLIVAYFFISNAWAIVLGYLVENVFRCGISFIICPFLPRFKIDRECFKELVAFVRGIVGMPIFTILVTQIDDFFLGRMVAPGLYGIYTRGKVLSNMPQQMFARIINPVLLPAFTEKKKDSHATRKGLLFMTAATGILYLPMLVFLGLHAESLLSIVWGPDYGVVAQPFVWLFCVVIIKTQSLYFVSMTIAIGKPYIVRAFLFVRLALAAVMMYSAIKWYGITGATMVLVLSNLLALLFLILIIRLHVELSLMSYLRSWGPAVWTSLLALAGGMAVKTFLPVHEFVSIALTGIFAGIAFLAGLGWLKQGWFGFRLNY